MDVDRFDYMMRDPLHTNQKDLVFHPSIYMDNFEIINNEVVFNIKVLLRSKRLPIKSSSFSLSIAGVAPVCVATKAPSAHAFFKQSGI